MFPTDVYRDDLTSDTSVLVVHTGREKWFESRKYQHAVRTRPEIRLVSYETVLEAYQVWLKGEEIGSRPDKLGLLPVFDNISVSVSRLSEELGTKVKLMVESNGGTVMESISTVSDVLVTATPDGLRYTKAREWGVPVVSPDWVYDCVDRGALLSVTEYYLMGENSKGRRELACDWEKVEEVKKLEAQKAQTEKAKRGADVPEKEKDLKVRKIDKENKVWKSIMSNIRVSNLHRSQDDNWTLDQEEEEEEAFSQVSLLVGSQEGTESTLFEGVLFRIGDGFSSVQKSILEKVIKSHRGIIDENANYTIVNSSLDAKPAIDGELVTEMGIERCIFYKTVDFSSPWSKPFCASLAKKDRFFKDIPTPVICITGFKGVELSHLEKLLAKLPGCKLSAVFSKNTSLLIYNDELPKPELLANKKLALAAKWRLRCIPMSSFWHTFA
ncbi:hypothetical protein OGAPHI_003352 [Ogataea philodendri]|uniref:BRCT domain-containing protein n=1 Tax=Ogataea philodendri TaxID=1378263 RepID=A0A9P8P7R9_9ASCO|nr:uncharacterized protein OGAPHI_003352 [Ogataea philodendri]KAH3666902.1 hypothetical protein OGAPHI_003352 [Ogataea philodendri]